MGLNLTPQLHILTDHAIIQLLATKGFSDMREDRSHQDQMKNEPRLVRLRNKQSKMNSQAKQQERVNLESITQIQHDVAARTKQNITQNVTLKEENAKKRRVIRCSNRHEAFVSSLNDEKLPMLDPREITKNEIRLQNSNTST